MLGLALVFALRSTADSPADRAYVCSSSCRMRCQVSSRPSCGATSTVSDFGPIGQAFPAVGLQAPNFFSEQNMLGAIMNVVTWSFVGYNMVIMYSALRVVPRALRSCRDRRRIPARMAWSIKIPVIRPAILLTLIFSIIGSFQIFNEPQLFDDLAPTVIDDAYTPNYYAYNVAFVNQDVGYAAAIAFLLGIVIAVVAYVVQFSSQRRQRP